MTENNKNWQKNSIKIFVKNFVKITVFSYILTVSIWRENPEKNSSKCSVFAYLAIDISIWRENSEKFIGWKKNWPYWQLQFDEKKLRKFLNWNKTVISRFLVVDNFNLTKKLRNNSWKQDRCTWIFFKTVRISKTKYSI